MQKLAILHVPHEQCEKSIQEMLSSVGYLVLGIGPELSRLVNRYMKPVVASRLVDKAVPADMVSCDLFVTVKHYNLPNIYRNYRQLKKKVLWFDINGGVPGEVITRELQKSYPLKVPIPYVSANKRYVDGSEYKVSGPRYICYIPLHNRKELLKAAHQRVVTEPPVCLVHNPSNWGYGWLVEPLRVQHGVRFYGSHGAPDGLLEPRQTKNKLTSALCMVHAKGRDCPGCALYESLLVGCPVIITDLFLRRTLYTDLYVDGETCLVVKDDPSMCIDDRRNHLMKQLASCLERLKDPQENKRIGSNGRRRIVQLMWSSDRKQDVDSFASFMEQNFS